ncbi:hypothetical protein TRFO_14464 [Tritrichomonas foetus]|uniref:Uncharacterized protein n=1 Tax=Tritrichomonas foetus TaxID=1144522 RepID=A0A1J4KZJ2_9EUKA|nr:hypothetical protein TRFO_14464 [Tritrichomonas foetus]|eukprot:OHT15108.1 hypothetical protein TRFO_14464 [Tritrichomonas foetus]
MDIKYCKISNHFFYIITKFMAFQIKDNESTTLVNCSQMEKGCQQINGAVFQLKNSNEEKKSPIGLTLRQPSFTSLVGNIVTKDGIPMNTQIENIVFEANNLPFPVAKKASYESMYSDNRPTLFKSINRQDSNDYFWDSSNNQNDYLDELSSLDKIYMRGKSKSRICQIAMKLRMLNESRWNTLGYFPPDLMCNIPHEIQC